MGKEKKESSETQQKSNHESSHVKKSKVKFALKKLGRMFHMGKSTKNRKAMVAKTRDIAPSDINDDDAPLTPEELADLEKIQANIAEVKRLEALKAQQLIERGQLLEQAVGTTAELKQDTAKLTQTTHQVKRFEEAKNRQLNSVLIGMGGFAIGAGYGFLMGYGWPIMVVFGILAGSLTYGLSTFASKIIGKVVSIGDWFKGYSSTQSASSAFRVYEKPSPTLLHSLDKRKEVFMRYKQIRRPIQDKTPINNKRAQLRAKM